MDASVLADWVRRAPDAGTLAEVLDAALTTRDRRLATAVSRQIHILVV